MHELSVAFVWHHHQPYYPDDLAGRNAMPWVRLHGAKDYWGMAMHLNEVPEVRATINLVPSLLAQILAYTGGSAEDDHLRISRLPADDLSEADRLYLLDNFFMANPDHMIRPFPRYYELYQQRGLHVDSAARASRRFSTQDIRDLQCWSNLTWFHPIAFETDRRLAAFRDKGQHWTEAEKEWLLDKQMKLLAEIIPLHRELAERGQVELTTTPFYHPILPLLIDKQLAREALPQAALPHHLEGYSQDAAEQIRRAVEYHTRVFGSPPRGMWPSEGSVGQAIIPAVAMAGIEWIASDEEILARSTEGWISRDAHGLVRNPHLLYRPWRVEENGHALQMIFRDHALSDQIGFHYQRYAAEQAADDLIGRLEAIHRATTALASQEPTLVSIILDGENCWEYYPGGGVDFLRGLYHRLARHSHVKTVRVHDYLTGHPAAESLKRLFAGSWIGHNFGIWIGQPACNRAWDLLSETRAALVKATASGAVGAAEIARAWEELYIAEGSDWFWWFDENHSSGQDWLFDQLFRKHLQNVYLLLGDQSPAALLEPIGGDRKRTRPFTQPTGLLSVKIDGRETYFEWLNAGVCTPSAARGTMTMVKAHRIEELYFGFEAARLLLRFDTEGSVRKQLADVDTLRVVFSEPAGFELLVTHPGASKPIVQLFHNDVPVSAAGVEAAADTILEIAIPWRSLAAATDAPLHFHAELIQREQSVERIPHSGAIETFVPSPDYELMMWQA
ncbi:MAG: alpha-amylase/alpha-mannosidase [Planctomycetia bacterium]|nr:alpha-amylase/alpha-mannosidase [Planctomycetia bacterium]